MAYVRVCPVCDTENPPERARCDCGALLTGVDFSLPRARAVEAAVIADTSPAGASAPAGLVCPHVDCAQRNPAGESTCVYCGRPLVTVAPPSTAAPAAASPATASPTASVPDTRPLPQALRADYRVVDAFPATGSEADILLTAFGQLGERRVVKLYRRGLKPDFALLELLSTTLGPTVVHVLAHGVSEGTAYEVLEYVPGGTLEAFLAEGPVVPSEVRAIVRDVADALAGIHAHGILHRDVKPDNILLRSRAPLSLALTDFGIASLSMATQHFTGGARTTRYAAPEVLTGVLDAKADWWSLGMIVLEAATGQHPFEGLTEQVMNHHLATRPIDVSAVFDEDLRRLCRGLLLRDPKRRFGGDEVRRWLDNDPTLAALDDVVDTARSPTPYRLVDSTAVDARELALALARHWDEARRDLVRGQIVRWVEDALHDHNLARKLRDIVEPRDGSGDRKLALALRALAPDLPPLWRGEPLGVERVLAKARAAVGGDDAAAQWTGSLYEDHILALAQVRPDLAALDAKWRDAMARFEQEWRAAEADEVAWRRGPEGRAAGAAGVDELLYGASSRLAPPPPYAVTSELLVACDDAAFVDALRRDLRAGAASLGARVPWFDAAWRRAGSDPVATVVAHHLLPRAREESERIAARVAAGERALEDGIEDARERVRAALAALLAMLDHEDAVGDWETEEIVDALEAVIASSQAILALDLSAPRHAALRDLVDRLLLRGFALRGALAKLALVEGMTALMHDPNRLGLAAMVAFLGLLSRNAYVIGTIVLVAAGFVGYRAYRRHAARSDVIRSLRDFRLPARMFLRQGN